MIQLLLVTRGGNFDPFTYEWVDSGSVLYPTSINKKYNLQKKRVKVANIGILVACWLLKNRL